MREPRELSTLMRGGVPSEMRPAVWTRCLEMQATAPVQEVETMEPPDWVFQLIETDVPRTQIAGGDLLLPEKQEALRLILSRFAVENPDIGYCQALNFVAAVFLMVFNTQEAVPSMMRALIFKLDVRQWYTAGMQRLRADARVFRELVRKRMPIINGALHKFNIDPLTICPRWFLSLFSAVLGDEPLLRVWDAIVADGMEAVFRVAMALLAWKEDELVRLDSEEEVLELVLSHSCEVDADELLAIAYHPDLLGPRPGILIADAREEALKKVLANDEETPGGAGEAARAMLPYLLAHHARGLMAAGRQARGESEAAGYHFGDLSWGLFAKSKQVVNNVSFEDIKTGVQDIKTGVMSGVMSKLTARGSAPAARWRSREGEMREGEKREGEK